MIRAVIDTNVVLSAILWGGKPAQILYKANEGQIQLISSNELLAELLDVFARPKFLSRLQLIGNTPEGLVAGYQTLIELVEAATIPSRIAEDPDDDAVLACAVSGKANYIVSGDDDLLRVVMYEQIPIVTVSQFLDHLNTAK